MSDGFSEVHPTRRIGYPIEHKQITSGRNHDDTSYKESGFIRCIKCGHIYNTNRHPKGWGDGITNTTHSYTNSAGVTQYYGDPSVGGGCPFCGTFER